MTVDHDKNSSSDISILLAYLSLRYFILYSLGIISLFSITLKSKNCRGSKATPSLNVKKVKFGHFDMNPAHLVPGSPPE